LIVLIGGYFIYQNIPGNPENFKAVFNKEPQKLEVSNLSLDVKQFYLNMKFNHNEISYTIDINCLVEKKDKTLSAFKELSDKVNKISFYENNENPDIEVSCSEIEKHSVKEDYFIAGEGGAKEIIQTGRYNVITQGVILFNENPKNSIECNWPIVELHELLHVFGFGHSDNKDSLMYPYLENCNQELDQSILDNLNNLYSQENLADLYFEKVDAVKKGRYLDFNVSIKNSGTIMAKNVSLSVIEDKKIIKQFELDDLSFGAGTNLAVSNINLDSRSSNEISIVIDEKNNIKEIDETNNVAELRV
ncbi:MAG: CARDB domain-containing protein, partial [Nanoarchaeota archaeon]